MTAREVINRLRQEGWADRSGRGSRVFTKPGRDYISVPNLRGGMPSGTLRSIARVAGWAWPPPTVKERETLAHYSAIAERGDGRTWWITFPGRDGIVSAADGAGQIVFQAQDALASAAMYGGRLPPAIEDGAEPPADLSEFERPTMVVVIPFEHTTVAKAAA